MGSLKLTAEPTFKVSVQIPVAGAGTVPVVFTFKHRTKSALDEFYKGNALAKKTDLDVVMDTAVGWDLEEEWNAANVATFLENYMASGSAITGAYVKELMGGAKLGN